MDSARKKILNDIFSHLSGEQVRGVGRCADRIRAHALGGKGEDSKTVLIAYGGGKDSSYMLSFMRAVQIIVHRDAGRTFRCALLPIATAACRMRSCAILTAATER
jgi:hypothetical protein